MSPAQKKALNQSGHLALSLSWQCRVLKLIHTAFDYKPAGIEAVTLETMKSLRPCFDKISVLRESSAFGVSTQQQDCNRSTLGQAIDAWDGLGNALQASWNQPVICNT